MEDLHPENPRGNIDVRQRQEPLRERYKTMPEEARITDRARSVAGVRTDPFHGSFAPGSQDYGITWPFGIHRAVGGFHDGPNPGDLLCAALATCLDSTLRMIAERLGVSLTSLEVDVKGEIDVRGTLAVDREVPVGMQSMHCDVNLSTAEGTDPQLVKRLLAAAERCCVNLQTLRHGVPVETSLHSH
jgi:uncharacterized OsmC-like protein